MNRFLTITFITLLIALSCRSNDWRTPANYSESVLCIPDSMATKEQRALQEKIMELIVDKCEVRDNKFFLNADKNDFVSRGISPLYLDFVNQSLDETNNGIHLIDSINAGDGYTTKTDVEDMLKRFKEEYKTKRKEI